MIQVDGETKGGKWVERKQFAFNTLNPDVRVVIGKYEEGGKTPDVHDFGWPNLNLRWKERKKSLQEACNQV